MCEDKKEGKTSNIESLGEVRLKKYRLCMELVNVVRGTVLKRYKGKEELLAEQPVDSKFEVYILTLCCEMLTEYCRVRYKTTAEEDEKLLKRKNVKGRLRFAVLFRLEAKNIVLSNIKYLKLLIQILKKVKSKKRFKETYMEVIENLETKEEVNRNRRAIRWYLRSYYYFFKDP